MAAMHKILVGIDFSKASEAALKRAAMLAKVTGASLRVLHIMKDAPYEGAASSLGQVELMSQLEKEVSEKLGEWVQDAVTGDVAVESQVKIGIPYHDLLLAAEEFKVDLLIVGSRGKGLLKNIFLGSVAETVARKSLIPVWVERETGSEPIQRILLLSDLSKHAEAGVLAGLEWAKFLKAQVTLMHVVEDVYIPSFSLIDPQDYEKKMMEIGKKHFEDYVKGLPLTGLHYETVVTQGEAISEIEKVVRDKKISLIVLSTHGRTGLAYRVMGSVATKVLRHAPCNTLVVRPGTLDFGWMKKEIFGKK